MAQPSNTSTPARNLTAERLLSSADLSQAVELIQRTAAKTVPAQLVEVDARDGAGDTYKFPVMVVRGPDGESEVLQLPIGELDALARARRLAEEPGPDHREGTARHQTISSFIEHVHRFSGEHSAVWADAAVQRQLVAVFDYHQKGEDGAARWGRHRAIYPCPLSPAWGAWGGVSGLTLTQEQLAELLDTRDAELRTGTLFSGASAPSPADLVTLAGNLEVTSTSKATKKRDPNTQRVSLAFTEDSGVSGPGGVAVPAAFLISIPIFKDGPAADELEVRLRVTIADSKARFALRIHRAEEQLADAFEELTLRVGEETKRPVFIGTPEA